MLQLYRQHGAKIFPITGVTSLVRRRIRQLLAPAYLSVALREALGQVLGDRRLGEAKPRLVIPAYDAVACNVHIFKTAHHEKLGEDYKRAAVEVALATSAAPTFLPLHQSSWGQRFLDGGLWANSPAVVAILEAHCVLGRALDEIDLLRIGTTSEPLSIVDRARRGGLLRYRGAILDLLLDAQDKAAAAQMRFLLGRDQVTSINATVQPRRYDMDDPRRIDELIALGQHDGRHNAPNVVKKFMQTPVDQFVPARS